MNAEIIVNGTSATKKTRRTEGDIKALDQALLGIVNTIAPCTVRQCFYQAVVKGLVPKEETTGYRIVQRRLVELRESGAMSYGKITDNMRIVRRLNSWDSPDSFLQESVAYYRRDYWANAPVSVEVWIEKDGLASTLYPLVVREWGLELFVSRGFSSLSYLQGAAEDIKASRKPTFVYVLSDFDPSGIDLARKIAEELPRRAAPVPVTVQRLAVTPAQIQAFDLPTRDTKKTDSRAPKFIKLYGDRSVELDAIPPATLRALVGEAIERHANTQQIDLLKKIEASEREGLRQLSRSFLGRGR